MELETIVITYLGIVGFGMFSTLVMLMSSDILEEEFEGFGFWDWFIYNLLWIVQPIKAIVRFVKRLFK